MARHQARPKHVLVRLDRPDGLTQIMNPGQANKRAGHARGGHTTQASGACRTRFTSQTGRAAVLARYAKRRKGPSGRWIGQPIPATRVDHAALRARYTSPTHAYAGTRPVLMWYQPDTRTWQEQSELGTRTISERSALMRLGALPYRWRRHGAVPVVMTPLPLPKHVAHASTTTR